MICFYPVKQLKPNVDYLDLNEAKDTYPDPRLELWWYSYQMGLSLRLFKFAGRLTMKDSTFSEKFVENFYAIVAGGTQFIISNTIMGQIVKEMDWKDWRRVSVTASTLIGWEADSLSMMARLLPDSVNDFISSSALYVMCR